MYDDQTSDNTSRQHVCHQYTLSQQTIKNKQKIPCEGHPPDSHPKRIKNPVSLNIPLLSFKIKTRKLTRSSTQKLIYTSNRSKNMNEEVNAGG